MPVQLGNLDLNLLVTLDAVLTERSVGRAAVRLGVTQPAVSHALRRLRELLDDPLLIRTPRGMIPTPRAERITDTLRRCLSEIGGVIQGDAAFDPATARRTFTLGAIDATQFVLLPALMKRLARAAPGIDLVVRTMRGELFASLESGSLDVAIGSFPAAPEAFRRKPLYHQRYVCLVRRDHPTVGEKLTLEDYVSLSHVAVAPMGLPGNPIEEALAKLGHRRRVALEVPHFLVAPLVVAETDFALLLPELVGKRFAEMLSLRVLPPPIELAGFTVSQLWHERVQLDPAHMWLRQTLAELSKPA